MIACIMKLLTAAAIGERPDAKLGTAKDSQTGLRGIAATSVAVCTNSIPAGPTVNFRLWGGVYPDRKEGWLGYETKEK